MKWIGQHIWDFISRFRSDVYLESVDDGTIVSGGNLGLDSNNKVVKADTNAGELSITNAANDRIVTSTGGTGLNAEQYFTWSATDVLSLFNSNGAANTPIYFTPRLNGFGYVTPPINFHYGVMKFTPTSVFGNGVGGMIEQGDFTTGSTSGAPLSIKAGAGYGTGSYGGNLEMMAGRGRGNGLGGKFRFWSTIASGVADDTINGMSVKFQVDNVGDVSISGVVSSFDSSHNVAGSDFTIQGGNTGAGISNNQAGGDLILNGGQGKGTGAGGDIVFKTANAGSSGSTLNSLVTAFTISDDLSATFAGDTTITGALTMGSTAAMTNAGLLSVAAQPNITTMTGFVTGSANEILTDDGDGTVTSESNLTWDGDHFLIESATSQYPLVEIKSTTNSNKGSVLKFVSDKGAGGLDGDTIGVINWFGDDISQTQRMFATLSGKVSKAAVNDVAGEVLLTTLQSNGSGSNGQGDVIKGVGRNDETVDVDIAHGASSVTTIAGKLEVTGSVIDVTASAAGPSKITLREDTDNGTSGVSISAPLSLAADRIIELPDANGTVALTSDIPKSIIVCRNPPDILFYMFRHSHWHTADASTGMQWGAASAPNTLLSGATLSQQVSMPLVVAISDMRIYKVVMNWRWQSKSSGVPGDRPFEWSFHTSTVENDNQTEQTLSTALTVTDNDTNYEDNYQYLTTWDIDSGSGITLSAGDALSMFGRCTYTGVPTLAIQTFGSIYIEYKYV